jgi:hypothetical protein
MSQDINPGH